MGTVWWIGPQQNGVHLLVSMPFRKESTFWANPVHVGDCEVVPEATYEVTAVLAADETESTGSVSIETTLFAPGSSSWWGDCVGSLVRHCDGDIRKPTCETVADCAGCTTPCERAWTLPNGVVNFRDIKAALDRAAPGPTSVPPEFTWVDLHGNSSGTPGSEAFDPPNFVVNFLDIGQIVAGFGGFPYKGYDPKDCPDTTLRAFMASQQDSDDERVASSIAERMLEELGKKAWQGADKTNVGGRAAKHNAAGTDRSSTPEISWVPVDASVSFTTDTPNNAGVDTRMILEADDSGEIVEFELRVSGWSFAPGAPTLGTYQATLDASGLSGSDPTNLLNGTTPGVDLTPLNNQAWRENPGGNGLNDGAFLSTNTCHDVVRADSGLVCGSIPASMAWDACPGGAPLCLDKDDFVFAGNLAIGAVSTATPNLVWGGVTNVGACTTGDGSSSYYAGTLVLNVPADAVGTYAFGFKQDTDLTFLDDCDSLAIPGVVITPGAIKVDAGICFDPADCADNNACTDDTCNSGTCANSINYDVVTECCDPVSGSVVVIDDGDICTEDTCDPVTGLVSHIPTATTFPAVVRVKGDAFGADDGTSWADAYVNLQDGLGDAQSSGGVVTEIWVAEGIYNPDDGAGQSTGDRTATFQLISGVGLYGGFNGMEFCRDERNIEFNETILSGDLIADDAPVGCAQDSPDCDSFGALCVNGNCIIANNNAENSYHVVTGSGTDAASVFDGFTITAGNADGTDPNNRGAGMFNDAGSPTVTNCTITENWASEIGGGMYNEISNSPTITNCTFIGNSAFFGGGGMFNFSSSPAITNCSFMRNWSDFGGGMANNNSSPTATNCIFSGNSAGGSGGGIFNSTSSTPTVTNCTFSGNSATGDGGGIHNNTGSLTVTNCTLSGNSADRGGGMFNVNITNLPITNSTFSGNSAASDGGGMANIGNSSPTVTNCILWGNSDAGGTDESAQIHTDSGTPVVNYSIVQGGWTGAGGTGNSSSDPVLVRDPDDGGDGWGDDPATPGIDEGANDDFGDLRLLSGSPAIDAGDNDAVPPDSADLDDDGDTAEPTPFDLDGVLRFLEDLLTVDTGNAGALGTPIVDMGAYEYLRDCNGNGNPDDQDLANCAADPACSDCNANDIPDKCDINDCDGSAWCDDCDLNGIPDGCVTPGLCIFSSADGNWTDDIWGLGGDYPDNINGVANLNVTLDDVTVTLDTDVVIETLRVIDGATLDVTGGDLTVVDDGGILVDGSDPPPGETGSTLAVGDGQTVNTTNLTISGDENGTGSVTADGTAVINISDSLNIEGGGEYGAAGPGSSAQLNAGSVTISGGDGDIPGGTMTLTDSMGVTTTGDFVMDGTNAGPCDVVGLRVPSGRPPILSLVDDATLDVGGNMFLTGSTSLTIGSDADLQVNGDFVNQGTSPDCFDWGSAGLTFGGGAPVMRSVQVFETAGGDYGPNPDGFAPPGTSHTNFSMGTVEIPAGASVRFVDNFDNDGQGEGFGLEALYVQTLILRAGSAITIENCKVYHGQLIDEGATVTLLRAGGLSAVSGYAAEPLTAPYPHNRKKNRYISFDPNKAVNDGEGIAFKIELKQITLGSCDGASGAPAQVDFCREDRSADDCNTCAGAPGENSCINQAIDCVSGTCTPTGETCVNDAPNIGGTNVGSIWWVGPESPLANGVHLMVSEPFRKISTGWPNPTHVGDCEIVPQAGYGVRAVNTDSNAVSDELAVETTLFASLSASWWGDCVGPLKKFCGGDIRTAVCTDDGDCTAPDTCDRAWTLPDGSVNFDDVNAALALVAPGPTSVTPEVTWVDLHGNASGTPGSQNFDPPNFVLNFSDIGQIISGFGGFPYKGYDPADCPDSGT